MLPVSVEITYGLERILMLLQVSFDRRFFPYVLSIIVLNLRFFFLQEVDHFKKIKYADGITYGELFSENE